MNDKLKWSNETRQLGDLIPWNRNPRKIKDTNIKRLQESFDEFNQVDIIAISPEGEIYNGHQRLKAWLDKYGPNLSVDVRVSSRSLTEHERKKLTIYLHKGTVGEWDFDQLISDFDVNDLLDWGFDNTEILDQDKFLPEPLEKQDYETPINTENSGRLILIYQSKEEKEWIEDFLRINLSDKVIFKVSEIMVIK